MSSRLLMPITIWSLLDGDHTSCNVGKDIRKITVCDVPRSTLRRRQNVGFWRIPFSNSGSGCSLIPGLGVKLSTTILAGPSEMPDLANRIIGHYEKHAAAWDRDRQNSHWNDKVWHERFIGKLGRGAKVLDLGCGPGRPVGQHMVEQGLRVMGVDSSPTMISFCRDQLPDQE
jgi:hypothetical protein